MRSSTLLVALFVLCSCALRPLYKEIAHPCGTDRETKLRLMDKSTHAPLAGLKIEMSEGKDRYSTTTAADGAFSLPLEKKYADVNPYLVVTGNMPNGYDIEAAQSCVLPVVAPVEAPKPVNALPAPGPTPSNQGETADGGAAGNIGPVDAVKVPQ